MGYRSTQRIVSEPRIESENAKKKKKDRRVQSKIQDTNTEGEGYKKKTIWIDETDKLSPQFTSILSNLILHPLKKNKKQSF